MATRMESLHNARMESLHNAIERASSVIEGFKIEAVGDRIVMTPQSSVQSETIADVIEAARATLGRKRAYSDVIVNFPGETERCPDVAIVEAGAQEPYSHEDLLAAIEVVSSKHDKNDYVIKTEQYARFGVPMYLIIDPFRGECDLLTRPMDGTYATRELSKYGDTIRLQLADGNTVEIPTDTFERRR
ncbi:Uma2 family endonuclease [Streptomyces sp. AV19]|uniref:Uma2 family endonuclease n=1 Tax=Streptomyces sp. AV19 TaxID=2793068 RepID=UPI0018FE0791|nr:Uma2 family endonuclease [Streptomyces sp. AV19]MBH1936771.1 Uma2 family endonuclease [Streptomyces sp. AV19]MDG4532826.1 Uma2 family endonuclease [Streptomyces sp. AV19]